MAAATVALAVPVLVAPGTAAGAATVGGDPACLSEDYLPESGVALSHQDVTGDTTVHVFGVGTDSQVWYRPIGGSTGLGGGWVPLGGVSLYGPAAVFAGSTDHVFVVGGDGAMWVRTNGGAGWGGWTSLGGSFISSPAAASLGAGHLRVFGTGGDGQLWSDEFAGGRWSGWHLLGGQVLGSPAATAYPAYGQVEASVMGSDGLVYTMGLGAGARSGRWIARDFAPCSMLMPPSVSHVAFPGDRAYLDSDWSMRQQSPPTEGSYRDWGGSFDGNPDIEYSGGVGPYATTIVGIGTDGAMWVHDYRWTYDWISLGGQFI